MIVMGLDGRGRRSRTQHLRITDYTKIVNLVQIISPIFRPDEALIYFLTKAWDFRTKNPSKNLHQLEKKVRDNKNVSIFAETLKKSLDENKLALIFFKG